MNIRITEERDAAAVSALVDSVARERRFLASTEGFSTESVRTFIASVLAAGGVHIVANDASKIVGWCDITPLPYQGMTHVGHLGMGVHSDCRGRGIGRKLLEDAVRRAFSSIIERVELDVFASNQPAIALYESFGFQLEGRKIAARKLDGKVDDILLYAKRKQV